MLWDEGVEVDCPRPASLYALSVDRTLYIREILQRCSFQVTKNLIILSRRHSTNSAKAWSETILNQFPPRSNLAGNLLDLIVLNQSTAVFSFYDTAAP